MTVGPNNADPRPAPLRARSRLLAIALSVVPGWGHVYWGRESVGLAVFTAFTVSVFALAHGYFLYVGPWREAWVLVASLVALATALFAWVDIVLRTRTRRVVAEAALRWEGLRRGMLCYVAGDIAGAARSFRHCLLIDPLDSEAQFRLGVACARLGERAEARKWLRRARRTDLEEKWSWEIRGELAAMRDEAADMPETADTAETAAAAGAAGAAAEPPVGESEIGGEGGDDSPDEERVKERASVESGGTLNVRGETDR